MFRGSLLILACLAGTGAADDLPRWVVNLARIRREIGNEIKRLPNYTCTETINRYESTGGAMKFLDRVVIQVAVAGDRELYAWPGQKAFEDQALADMVGNGFMADGNFFGMMRKIFAGQGARIAYAGEETAEGRAVLHYTFEIRLSETNWIVRVGGLSEPVATQGSFYVDASSLDLLSLNFIATDLPPLLRDKTLDHSIRYARITLAGRSVLIAKTTEFRAVSLNGDYWFNRATFDDCHEYGSQSTITFEPGSAAMRN
jgi:hypothetical protein